MKVTKGSVYKNGREYFTPAQSGDFFVVDVWKCDKFGNVKDLDENPDPYPMKVQELTLIGATDKVYNYPKKDTANSFFKFR